MLLQEISFKLTRCIFVFRYRFFTSCDRDQDLASSKPTFAALARWPPALHLLPPVGMPQRRRNSKAPSSCVSRIGREILKPSSSTSTSASSAVGSKRRSPVDTSNFAAVVPTSKQQRFTVSPAEEQSRPYHSDLSRTDSGVGFSETSAASAETQLLCTEAFGLEDESSSVPTDQSSEGMDFPFSER